MAVRPKDGRWYEHYNDLTQINYNKYDLPFKPVPFLLGLFIQENGKVSFQ
jgi:hypothetical protein